LLAFDQCLTRPRAVFIGDLDEIGRVAAFLAAPASSFLAGRAIVATEV
jgi:NAD(P)-dependent dehydrogenase (short-subunit alcohol dehydrogenase family)